MLKVVSWAGRGFGGRIVTLRASTSITVDTFELTTADIRDADLSQLHALSIAVGWPHRAEDWQFLLDIGHGLVAVDEIGRLMGSAMWFPQADGFATIGMVITSPRLQANGTGHWLMESILAACEGRNLRLSATRAARRLYTSLDFKPDRTIYQCQGEARIIGEAPDIGARTELRTLTRDDLDAIVALDAEGFGVTRRDVIERLHGQAEAVGLFRDGALVAFSLCRPFGRGHVVGPIVAATDADAIAVVRPHVKAHAGRFLRVDTRFDSGAFASFLGQSGMPVFDTVTAMSKPGAGTTFEGADQSPFISYALASQAVG